MTELASYILVSMGLTIILVWPQEGPTAYLRERVFRRILPTKAGYVFDCYICCSFWIGMLMSVIWWRHDREVWCLYGCLMVPAVFWIILRDRA